MCILGQAITPDTTATLLEIQTDTAETENLPDMATCYYSIGLKNLNRNFNYDLLNKKKMLNWTTTYIAAFGLVTYLAFNLPILLIYTTLWPIWATCCYIFGTAAIIFPPAFYLIFYFKKRADAIDVSDLAHFQINDRWGLEMVGYTFQPTPSSSSRALGIGITFNF